MANDELKAIASEMSAGTFSDERLNRRLQTIVEGVARNPEASFPSLMSAAELEGAYRFLSNPVVTPGAILHPHFEATKARVAAEPCVRIVHDQTEFCYRRDGKRKGLGNRAYQGFCGHFSLALCADASRKPLGLVGVHTWARGETAETEQSLWLKQIEATGARLGSSTKAIHICDRGSEDYALFCALVAADHRFVIRTTGVRLTNSGPEDSPMMLHDVLATVEHIATRVARINGRPRHPDKVRAKTHPPRRPRTVSLRVAATSVKLTRPANYGKKGRKADLGALPLTLQINVVRAWEPEPPEGEAPIEWLLFTNEPVATAADAVSVIEHYRARWTIEEYFKALKTGCAFERRQLHDYEALTNALAVFAPLAYQILTLRTLARDEPDAPATAVATDDQIAVLRTLGRRPLPPAPTARDILLAVAALGGHIKYAPDPGWLTIARGYEKLELLTTGWLAAKLQPASDQR